MSMQTSLQHDSLRRISSGEIAELNSFSSFSFLRTLHMYFHSACSQLHSQQQGRGVLFYHSFPSTGIYLISWWSSFFWGKIKYQFCFHSHSCSAMFNIFSCIYWACILLLRSVYEYHLPFFTILCWESNFFGVLHEFLRVFHCPRWSWQRLFLLCRSSLYSIGCFSGRSFLSCCDPIYWFLVLFLVQVGLFGKSLSMPMPAF